MTVLIDGKEVKVTNDVKIIYSDFDAEAPNVELHLTVTYEGLITDVIEAGEVLATASDMAQDLAERTH